MKNIIYIFDFDGTLYDSADVKLKTFKDFFKIKDVDNKIHKEYLDKNASVPREVKLTYLCDIYKYTYIEIKKEFDCLLEENLKECNLICGAKEFLINNLSKKIKQIIITAAPKKEVKKILIDLNLINLFDEVHYSVDDKLKCVSNYIKNKNIDLYKSRYFGDNDLDYKAAFANDIYFIRIGSGKADRNIKDFKEMK